MDKKTALILSGGGSNGAFQAGAIAYLDSQGVKFWKVRGISVGALNGLMVALRKIDDLKDIWVNISPEQVIRERGPIRVGGSYLLHKIGIHKPPLGYFSNTPLKELLQEKATGTLQIPFSCGVVHARNGNYLDYELPKGRNIKPGTDLLYVLASTAIPVVFDPVRINGSFWVDGGVRRQNPISPLLDHDPDEVIIINCGVRGKSFDRPVKDIVDVSINSLSAMMDEIFNVHQREFHRINHIVRQSQAPLHSKSEKQYKYYPSTTIEPDSGLGDPLDFTGLKARKLFEIGWQKAKEVYS